MFRNVTCFRCSEIAFDTKAQFLRDHFTSTYQASCSVWNQVLRKPFFGLDSPFEPFSPELGKQGCVSLSLESVL